MSEAVQAYVVDMRERGLSPETCVRAEYHLRRFFELDTKDAATERTIAYAKTGGLLDDLRPKRCAALYEALAKAVAVDTHRNTLVNVKAFLAWCVDKRWLRQNPAEAVKPVGQRNRGKQQLRIDEARRLIDLCVRKADQGDEPAVAVLTALLLGLRASEVTNRVVRDLDNNGRLLWIPFGKTRRSRRAMEVPEMLRPYLLALAKGRKPEDQLISRTISKRGRKRDRFWLLHHLHALCDEAKVPKVCSHSLRGLHATLATEAGATSHLVAAALGHATPDVTKLHYIEADATLRASSRRVTETLAGSGSAAARAAASPVGNG